MKLLRQGLIRCFLLIFLFGINSTFAQNGPIIIDHNCTDLSQIPDSVIVKVQKMIVQLVGQSHGKQIPRGLELLAQQNPRYSIQINTDYNLLTDKNKLRILRSRQNTSGKWQDESVDDNLYWSTEDGRLTTERVASYLQNNIDTLAASLWMWCWDMSSLNWVHAENNSLITYTDERNQAYLNAINRFNTNYPRTHFVYVTSVTDMNVGHRAWFTNNWNDEIRARANQTGGILFDQADIENWNESGNEQKIVTWNDNGISRNIYLRNDDYSENVGISFHDGHTNEALCIKKAKAFWWMLARLATDWNGVPQNPQTLSISGISSDVTLNSATINWATNLPATSQIEFGLTNSYGNITPADVTFTRNHSQTITGLQPGTTYHYRVISVDGSNNRIESADNVFTTTPEITYYSLTVISQNGLVTKQPDLTQYEAGTQVALTATPIGNYNFISWSGDATGTNNTTTIIMDGNKNVTANFTQVTQPPVVTTDEFLAYWNFNEEGISVLDHSGNNNNGVIVNADPLISRITGYEWNAVTLDGEDEYINFGSACLSSFPTNEFTIDLCFKAEDLSRQSQIIFRRGTHMAPFSIALEKTQIKAGVRTNESTFYVLSPSAQPIITGKWYRLVLTFADNVLSLYLDGELVSVNNSITGNSLGMGWGTNYTLAGRNSNQDLSLNEFPFKGSVDAIKVYGNAQTASEILNNFLKPVEIEMFPSMIGYWKLNEPAGTILYDLTGKNSHALLVNSDESYCRIQGPEGSAIQLDGTDDYINFGEQFLSSIPSNELSVSLWFKADDVSRTEQIILRRGRYIAPFSIALQHNRVKIGLRTTNTHYLMSQTSTKILTGKWYHLAITYSGGNLTLYLNGKPESSLSNIPGTSFGMGYGRNYTLIGRNTNNDLTGNEYPFHGAVDEVMFFDSALPHNAVKVLSEKHLVAEPLLIESVSTSVTAANVTVSWTTNVPSTSQVEYGLTSSYGNITVTDPVMTKNHSVVLSNLQPATQYHFRVISKDEMNRNVLSSDRMFTTARPRYFNLTINSLNGNVTKEPDLTQYAEGTQVSLIANPSEGYVFHSWSRDVSGISDTAIITINSDKIVTANFIPESSVGQHTSGLIPMIKVDPGMNVEVGEAVFLSATGTLFAGDASLLRKAKYEWDFGDGYSLKKGFPFYYIDGAGIACVHYFMKPGVFPVKLKVTVNSVFNNEGKPLDAPLAVDSTIIVITVTGTEPLAGFELQHAPIHARLSQYIYAQIPPSCQSNSTTLQVTLLGPGETSTELFSKSGLNAEEIFLLDNKSLTQGDYVLQAVLLQSDGEQVPGGIWREKFSKDYSGVPKVGFDENNSMHVNGELFFPIMPFMIDVGNMQKFIDSAAVNTVHTEGWYSTHNVSTWTDFLNQSASRGLKVAGPTRGDFVWGEQSAYCHRYNHDVDIMADYVTKTKDHSSLLMWSWTDEPNLGGWNQKVYSPVLAAWQYFTHKIDNQHPSYDNFTCFDWLRYYQANPTLYDYPQSHKFMGGKKWIADATGGDIYPMESRLHVALNYSDIGPYAAYILAQQRLRANNKNLVPHFPALQICEENSSGINATPAVTDKQVYMEAWMNVIHGAKGILWFPYFHSASRRWHAMKTFADQMKTLAPVVLGPETNYQLATDANVALKRVDAMIREKDGDIYIFTVRVTEPDPIPGSLYAGIEPEEITANFEINGFSGTCTIEVIDENRTVTMTNGCFSDTYERNAVHIYRISSQPNLSKKNIGEENIPFEFRLEQNYPNPFNPATTIYYQVPGLNISELVTLKVFDVIGREIATLVNEAKVSGRYKVNWNATQSASGVYFYQLKIGNNISTKKMMFVK